MGFSGCHPATGPANGLSLTLPFTVAIIYTEGDIRTSVMTSQARFVGVYAGVACALSFCHLVTIWCPNGMLGDHFVPLTRNPMHLRTIVTLRNLNSSNVELHQTTLVNNSLFRLITGRSQVQVLVGPPYIFSRLSRIRDSLLFSFGDRFVTNLRNLLRRLLSVACPASLLGASYAGATSLAQRAQKAVACPPRTPPYKKARAKAPIRICCLRFAAGPSRSPPRGAEPVAREAGDFSG